MKNKELSEYEKAKWIRSVILNRAAEVMNYNWGDDFSSQRIKEIPEKLSEQVESIDITQLTKDQMIDLGFGKWEENSKDFLIPLWLFPWLKSEIITKCIDGTKTLMKKDMDTDHRYGLLAYSVYPLKD